MSVPILIPVLIQAFYTLSATSILLAAALPPLKSRFVAYGKTSVAAPSSGPSSSSSTISKTLDFAATLTVPHRFFAHFYILGLALSIFWAVQCITHSTLFQVLAAHSGGGAGMRIEQVLLAWACFTAQVARRLYECLYIQRPGSTSRMWILHYVVGLLFYTFMSVGVWIEGSDAIAGFSFSYWRVRSLVDAPSLKSFIGIIVFLLASGAQHDAHAYLASLQKYSLPQHPLFGKVLCPHYTAEVLIYAAIALVAAPRGALLNKTVAAGTLFVATILGVAAGENRRWYRGKFGEAVRGRWALVPGVY